MNLLILEPTGNLDQEFTDLATRERSTALPIAVDERYNLIVCKECGIGLPSEL